ncbi:alpha/beta hydrolase [Opitutus terrae]|uniref:Alpha/beta hydrolase fold-3 domain-containing protein n=1 Tax=Opitutus terrae (strain DSM 11246 / JCM 15787 / PB90-1) TaxID=452637 RepID=B1ZYY8_OPITP|nr:alpha/beta hydrolase [Opitutus terrae]ACB76311.1 conserved hypothetical protein [Opitutus terrae PB90-1]
MLKLRLGLVLLALGAPALAQQPPEVIPLWPNGAPGFEGRKNEPERAKDWWVKNVHFPTLTVFRPAPDKANGCAVVIAPGGGFRELVFNAEGRQPGELLASLGVTAFALKYRLPNEEGSDYTFDHVQQDAYRAMRIVRSRAREFQIDPNRIGALGFSAGGAVVMMIAFTPGEGDPQAADPIDRANGRPNFQMLIYPGGKAPAKIGPDAPPAFLLCANDDEYGCDEVTMQVVEKLRAAKVPVELHLLRQGRHGFNMGDRSHLASVNTWPRRLADWLNDSGYLQPASGTPAATAPR